MYISGGSFNSFLPFSVLQNQNNLSARGVSGGGSFNHSFFNPPLVELNSSTVLSLINQAFGQLVNQLNGGTSSPLTSMMPAFQSPGLIPAFQGANMFSPNRNMLMESPLLPASLVANDPVRRSLQEESEKELADIRDQIDALEEQKAEIGREIVNVPDDVDITEYSEVYDELQSEQQALEDYATNLEREIAIANGDAVVYQPDSNIPQRDPEEISQEMEALLEQTTDLNQQMSDLIQTVEDLNLPADADISIYTEQFEALENQEQALQHQINALDVELSISKGETVFIDPSVEADRPLAEAVVIPTMEGELSSSVGNYNTATGALLNTTVNTNSPYHADLPAYDSDSTLGGYIAGHQQELSLIDQQLSDLQNQYDLLTESPDSNAYELSRLSFDIQGLEADRHLYEQEINFLEYQDGRLNDTDQFTDPVANQLSGELDRQFNVEQSIGDLHFEVAHTHLSPVELNAINEQIDYLESDLSGMGASIFSELSNVQGSLNHEGFDENGNDEFGSGFSYEDHIGSGFSSNQEGGFDFGFDFSDEDGIAHSADSYEGGDFSFGFDFDGEDTGSNDDAYEEDDFDFSFDVGFDNDDYSSNDDDAYEEGDFDFSFDSDFDNDDYSSNDDAYEEGDFDADFSSSFDDDEGEGDFGW
jgi:hypothetical protein